MTVDISSVGATAVLTAHMRALESTREDRLFNDPYAADLVAASGLGLEASVTLDKVVHQRVYESLAVRTHYLDSWCATILGDSEITQIVLLGAGLDTRALRLDWLSAGHAVFEVDLADVADLKADELHVGSVAGWHGVVADLSAPDWTTTLVDAGFDPTRPALVIAEGLFMYLEDDVSRAIVSAVHHLTTPGTYFLGVHFGHGAVLDAETQAMSAAAKSNGYGFASAINTTPQDWLGTDWQVHSALSIAQYAPKVGREIPYDETAIGAEVTWMFAAEATP